MPPLRAMEWVSHLAAADGSDRSREIGRKTKHSVVTSKGLITWGALQNLREATMWHQVSWNPLKIKIICNFQASTIGLWHIFINFKSISNWFLWMLNLVQDATELTIHKALNSPWTWYSFFSKLLYIYQVQGECKALWISFLAITIYYFAHHHHHHHHHKFQWLGCDLGYVKWR